MRTNYCRAFSIRDLLLLLIFPFVFPANSAEPLKVLLCKDGKVYYNAVLTGTDESGVKLTHENGVAKVLYKNLPDDLQKEFSFDPATAELHARKQEEQDLLNRQRVNKERADMEMLKARLAANGEAASAASNARRQELVDFVSNRNGEAAERNSMSPQQAESARLATEAQAALDSWKGHHKSEIIKSWGVPTLSASDGKDGEILIYKSSPVTIGGSGYANTTGTVIGGYLDSTTTFSSGMKFTFIKKTEVFTGSDGIIYHLRSSSDGEVKLP